MKGNAAEEVVSLAFTIDRKGNVLDSRIETTSDDLAAEALAMLERAWPRRTRRQLRQAIQGVFSRTGE